MKNYETKDIRNVGIVGHGHSGKTSVVAGLLYAAGATSRLTRVDEGNTVTDYDEEEIQRKLTISTAVAAIEWKKTKINILDTPGFNMFVNDARATLIAADAAIVVVDGTTGVEPLTEKMWTIAEEFELPRALVINKLDRDRASFERTMESIHGRFGRAAVADSAAARQRKGLSRRDRSDPHEGVHLHAGWRRQIARSRDSRPSMRTKPRSRTKNWWRWLPRAKTI